MKKIILFSILSLVAVLGYSQTNSDKLTVQDTRSVNDLPNFDSRTARFDFKYRNIIGAPGSGSYSANLTICPWVNRDNSGGVVHQLNFNGGGIFYRTALPLASSWGGWQKFLIEKENGNVGIGTETPKYKLDVAGTIRAKEVKIEVNAGADFVFSEKYNLKPLSEVETFVKENQHLPEIPSEKQMQEDGLSVNEFQIKLLQKIEELTLYIIEQDKKNRILEAELKSLGQQVSNKR